MEGKGEGKGKDMGRDMEKVRHILYKDEDEEGIESCLVSSRLVSSHALKNRQM